MQQWILGAAAVALSALGVSSLPAQAEVHHFKSSKTLAYRVDRIAVRLTEASLDLQRADGRATVAAATGVAPDRIEAWPVPGWWLVEVPPTMRAVSKVNDFVSGAAAQPALRFATPMFEGHHETIVFPTEELLIGFQPEVDAMAARALLSSYGLTILEQDWANMSGAFRADAETNYGLDVLDLANALARHELVAWAEPDMAFTGSPTFIPNDPGFGNCWGLHNFGQSGGTVDMDMDAPEAWDITQGSTSIRVVIIDTGVQQNHPDINQVIGNDLTSDGPGNGGPVNVCDNHGTPVAGCVSARINNALGTVGIAPRCRSASARTFISSLACNGGWSSQASWTVDALAWAETINARVTNNSNYYGFTSSSIEAKYAQTRNDGMVHFASAGNFNSSPVTYPASIPEVNAVGALNRFGNRASFSSFGSDMMYAAPGESIYSTDRTGSAGYVGGDYATVSGTSFASPYTAGVAALMLSECPQLDADCVEQLIADTCVDRGALGWDTLYGHGFVNAHAAVVVSEKDSIVLTGPATAAAGTVASYAWTQAPPNSTYFFQYSRTRGGSVQNCHYFDIGPKVKTLRAGVNSGAGTGSYTSPPIPSKFSGVQVYLEVRADDGGFSFDSNALSLRVL